MNTSAIPTTLGGVGGVNVYVGLLMDTAVYANLFTMVYTRPADPGPYAQHGAGDTAAVRSNTNTIHKEERRVYNIDDNVDTALKQEVITAVEETYLSAQKKRTWGPTASLLRAS